MHAGTQARPEVHGAGCQHICSSCGGRHRYCPPSVHTTAQGTLHFPVGYVQGALRGTPLLCCIALCNCNCNSPCPCLHSCSTALVQSWCVQPALFRHGCKDRQAETTSYLCGDGQISAPIQEQTRQASVPGDLLLAPTLAQGMGVMCLLPRLVKEGGRLVLMLPCNNSDKAIT